MFLALRASAQGNTAGRWRWEIIQLDYDRGEVSFYNPEDMTHIYTHRDTFTEKLFPYFGTGNAGDTKAADIRICQTDISLSYSGRVVKSK